MTWLWLGLFSWLVIGIFAGVLARWLVPAEPPPHLLLYLGAGLFGALGGGLFATALGFGGLLGFDTRALVVATLGAVLAILTLAIASQILAAERDR